MLENISVIQGLIATKGLNAKGFFNKEDIFEDNKTTTTNQ